MVIWHLNMAKSQPKGLRAGPKILLALGFMADTWDQGLEQVALVRISSG
jgi:hypothetical protein